MGVSVSASTVWCRRVAASLERRLGEAWACMGTGEAASREAGTMRLGGRESGILVVCCGESTGCRWNVQVGSCV